MDEIDVAAFLHDRMRDRQLESAWSWEHCPTVHAGGDAPVGHTTPGDRTLPPGEVLHVDFGVNHCGYAADIQRLFYRPVDADGNTGNAGDAGTDVTDGDGGDKSERDPTTPPADLRAAYNDVRAAIDAAFETVAPGVQGFEVDAAARSTIIDRGWPAYEHAVRHNVGRNAHDGGTLLGPRWDRYGESPEGIVREGEIYTLELGVDTQWGVSRTRRADRGDGRRCGVLRRATDRAVHARITGGHRIRGKALVVSARELSTRTRPR